MLRLKLKFDSIILHEPVEILVALPQKPISGNKKFKALWCLHSALSSSDLFFERLNILDLVEEQDFAIVCPSFPNSYFINSYNQKIADFLDKELYPYLMSILPLSKNREENTCLGISMGAYGALCWGIRQSSFFGRLVCISGYYDLSIKDDPRIKTSRKTNLIAKLAHPHMKSKTENPSGDKYPESDLVLMFDKLTKEKILTLPKIDFYCGSEDYLSLPQNEYFYKLGKDKGINISCTYVEGDHNKKTWRKCIEIAF